MIATLLAATCAVVADEQTVEPMLRSSGEPGGVKRVSVVQREAELATINVPERISTESFRNGLSEALWSSTREAVALAFQDKSQTFAVVFVRMPDGRFSAADINAVEVGNFGKLGTKPDHFRRFETKPVKWLKRSDNLFQVLMETKAWDASGKALAASEPLVIKSDGTPLFR